MPPNRNILLVLCWVSLLFIKEKREIATVPLLMLVLLLLLLRTEQSVEEVLTGS